MREEIYLLEQDDFARFPLGARTHNSDKVDKDRLVKERHHHPTATTTTVGSIWILRQGMYVVPKLTSMK